MSTLTLFKERRQQQRHEVKQQQKDNKDRWKAFHAEEKRLYNNFCKLIMPFNGKKIGRHKLKVVRHDQKNILELFIDGKLYRVFVAETTYHSCNCSECADGGYGHEGSYTHNVECYKLDKKGKRIRDYFHWYGVNEEEQEEAFVESMDILLTKHEYNKDEE